MFSFAQSSNAIVLSAADAGGGCRKFGLLLRVKCVVELILQDFGVGPHHHFSLLVKIPVEEHTERDGL